MKKLHGEHLKLFKNYMNTYFIQYIKNSDIFFEDVFSPFKLLCKIKQYPVANDKSYLPNEHKMPNCFEKVITHL